MSNAAEKLNEILGFDPSKSDNITKDAFIDVVKELQIEKMHAVKVKAKELLKKAMELKVNKDKADKEYKKQSDKFEKELGTLLRNISNMTNGVSNEEESKTE